MTIKSLNFDQHEILNDILSLRGLDHFDIDLTYGNGAFYKHGVPQPPIKIDLDGSLEGVIEASSTDVNFIDDAMLDSAIFDPPFLTYVRAARKGNGDMVMAGRFSGYWRYDELEKHYRETLEEAARILKAKGTLVVKCQDIIHNHKMHCTHANVIEWAKPWFNLADMFVLGAKHRMPSPNRSGKQKHARIYHCYFLVLERKK